MADIIEPHRKKVQHYSIPGHVHELTFSCYQQKPLLSIDLWCQDLAEFLHSACRRHQFGLLAYVFMPDHVHLLVLPLTSTINLPRFLNDTKRLTSRRIKQRLITTSNRLLPKLTIQQRPGVSTFRFWQEGPGYDRNLTEPNAIIAAMNYIHLNPVRRDLCSRATDWKWSSANRLFNDQKDLSEIPALTRFDPHSQIISQPPTKKHC